MNKYQKMDNQIAVYQSKTGAIEIKRDVKAETVWATQIQIAEIFGVERSVATKHIRNLFTSGELDKKSNVQFLHIANSDKRVAFYNLDIILAIGYRTNSKRAIEFRKWATKTLRKYIMRGYALNKNRIAKNYQQFSEAVENVKQLLPASAAIDTQSVLELVSMFADTWLSLEAYDKGTVTVTGATKKHVVLTTEKLLESLAELKRMLTQKDEASELFGNERHAGAIAGIVGNVMQSFGGKNVYESIEEKAAHLLYFMVKNHPFTDGNKRSGAYAFVWFLRQAKILDTTRLTPPALTALTILVAESNPKEKEKMIGLILMLLAKRK